MVIKVSIFKGVLLLQWERTRYTLGGALAKDSGANLSPTLVNQSCQLLWDILRSGEIPTLFNVVTLVPHYP